MSPVVKRSISFPADLDAAVTAAAQLSGESVSAWVTGVLADRIASDHRLHQQRLSDGLEAVREWEADNGAFTEAELAAGQDWFISLFEEQGPGRIRRSA